MGYVSWFSRDMIAGRGFIGMAAQQLGQMPLGRLFQLVFGAADAAGNNLQALPFRRNSFRVSRMQQLLD